MQATMIHGFRLSPQQRHLWRLGRGGPGWSTQCALLLEGEVDRNALQQAVRRVVEKHEILRTAFHRKTGMKVPLQVVHEQGELAWSELDLTDELAGEEEPELAAGRLLHQCRSRGFDSEGGPLVDCTLLRLGPVRNLLVLRLSPLCADSRSLANLTVEIGRRLPGGPDGEDGEETLQYLQFSEWQNELQEDVEHEAGREFWRRRAVLPSAVKLPFETESAAGPAGWDPQALAVVLPPALVERLQASCRAEGTRVPVFLLACWQVLLWRLSGEREIAVATVYDGRKFIELERALGPLAKSIPLVARLEEGLRFRDVLLRVQRSFDEAHDWQEYFAWPEDVEPAPGAAFEFMELPPPLVAGRLRLSLQAHRTAAEPFKVKLLARYGAAGLACELQWDGHVLSGADVRSLARQLETLVAAAAAAPGTAIEALEMLAADERQRWVEAFNRTAADLPSTLPVHRLFEAQVRLGPERLAVRFEEQGLTYGELNVWANRLAHRLRELGVGPEAPAGIYLERSADVIVAMLAVLKAGGAYVPLDLTLPGQRLAAMIAATGMAVVVTRDGLREPFADSDVRTVTLEEDLSDLPDSDLAGGAEWGNLAYVLFTSGSTGTPKGVGIEHRQLAGYVHAVTWRLDLPPGSSYATVSTFGADLGNTAVFPALCSGGLLHVVSYERALDPEAFAEYLDRHGVDCLKIVPSHLSTLLSGSSPERVLPRRLLVLGGEASRRELAERVRQLAPECRILNHYGPTEATVGVMTYAVEEDGLRRPTLPLGRPLANSRIYLLRQLRPVAPGEVGEIHIGGAGLARGYHGQPAATAERFIPDPFAGHPGERLYRTGDLARFLPAGVVEFLGRADHQVKIRGFRVELGEIESVLRRHPAVQDAVVLLREDVDGDRRLVAYAVAPLAERPTDTDLRELLRASLPEHMLPASVVWLDALPLGPNGKLDRQALPAPEEVRLETPRGFTAPRTLGEEMLVELWSEILRGQPVGIHDNFFELGGDSLQAIQLVSRVRDVFGVELPVRSLFVDPTVAGLAQTIERAVKGGAEQEEVRLERVPRTGDLPLSFAQQRLWFMHQMNPDSPAYNTTGPIRLQGRLEVAALSQAMDEVVRRHEVLRTTFPARNGEPVQVVHPPRPVSLPVVDLEALPSGAREHEGRRLASAHAQRPFDLTTGPLVRVLLLRAGPEVWTLVGTMHHIISDGWSMGILVRELVTLYHAFAEGYPSPLPDLPLQYADFASWQRRWLQGEMLERQLAYWRRQLAGAPDVLELPTDHRRPERQSFRGGNVGSFLPPPLTRALRDLCRREGVTLFMVLLAVFKVLLARYADREDIVVGTDVANRTRLDLEGLIGFFVNNLVLRTDLSGNPTFREALARVRETTLGAFAHQDLPFELLVRELQPRRSLSQTPLFQVLFVLQNTPVPEVTMPTLSAAPAPVDFGLTKFDLAVFVSELDGGLTVNWSYCTELFEAATMARMAARFETLLASIVEQPEAPLSKLEMLTAAEREQRKREQSERRDARLDRLKRRA